MNLGYGKRGGDSKVDSLLGLTFSVLKEKRKPKLDFLNALVNPFTFDLKTTDSEDIDIYYLKYLAENMTTLDLSTTEEVLQIVYMIDRILMTLGADLLSYVQFLKKQHIIEPVTDESDESIDLDRDFTVASKLSIALCMLLFVKKLLVELYDIPDE